jgi:hypothetical protein
MRHDKHETVERRRRWQRRAAVVLACTCGTTVYAGPSVAAGVSQPKPSPEPLWRSFPLGPRAPRHATPGANPYAATPAPKPKPPAATRTPKPAPTPAPKPKPPAATRTPKPAPTPAPKPKPPAASAPQAPAQRPASRPAARPPVRETPRETDGGRLALKLGLIVLVGLGIVALVVSAFRRRTIRRLLRLWDALLERLYDLRLWMLDRPRSAAHRLQRARESLRELGWAVADSVSRAASHRPRLGPRHALRGQSSPHLVVAAAQDPKHRQEPPAPVPVAEPPTPVPVAEPPTPHIDAAPPPTTTAVPGDDGRASIAADLVRARERHIAVSLVLVRADSAAAADDMIAALEGDLADTHSGPADEDGVRWLVLAGVLPKRACGLAEAVLAGEDGTKQSSGLAVGIAGFPRHAETADRLLGLSRRALDSATAKGGGTVVLAHDAWKYEETPADSTAVEDTPIVRALLDGVGYPFEERPLDAKAAIRTP